MCVCVPRPGSPLLQSFRQAITLLSREALKVLPTLGCLLFGTALALHTLYGEGSSLLEGTGYVPFRDDVDGAEQAFVRQFRTFGTSCGTVLAAGLGSIRLQGGDDVP